MSKRQRVGVAAMALVCLAGGVAWYARKPLLETEHNRVLAAIDRILHRERHPIFPYSVVPGGIHDRREFDHVAADVKQHYREIPGYPGSIRETQLNGGLFYTSYRKNGKIYWTSYRIGIPRESVWLIGPGVAYMIRKRCGNRLSLSPQQPTLAKSVEPSPADLGSTLTGANPGPPELPLPMDLNFAPTLDPLPLLDVQDVARPPADAVPTGASPLSMPGQYGAPLQLLGAMPITGPIGFVAVPPGATNPTGGAPAVPGAAGRTSVPEPSSVWLLVFGAMFLIRQADHGPRPGPLMRRLARLT